MYERTFYRLKASQLDTRSLSAFLRFCDESLIILKAEYERLNCERRKVPYNYTETFLSYLDIAHRLINRRELMATISDYVKNLDVILRALDSASLLVGNGDEVSLKVVAYADEVGVSLDI